MSASSYILAIDQGSSGTKTVIFDEHGAIVAKASEPLRSYHESGFAEQAPGEIYSNVLASASGCMDAFSRSGGRAGAIKACGISNQRETFVVWDRLGQPLHRAVLWQCKRSVDICERLTSEGHAGLIKERTGLRIDPYFSGTKLIWLYENNPHIRSAIDAGEAWFGTVDTWLLYRFTAGRVYATDYTNASRTMFFNLRTLTWDRDLLLKFGLSRINLPQCHPSEYLFGETDFDGLLDQPLPITAMMGDSHAAAFGEGCWTPGLAKATLGTGCSILMDVGPEVPTPVNGMISTIAWSTRDIVHYALEGVIVSCGATIEWLKNELNLFADSADTAAIAAGLSDNGGVYLVPSFSGLGSPHWDMSRRASITGLTFGTGRAHIIRAALESIPYQIKDVIGAMEANAGVKLNALMIDGGISSNRFVVQFLADLLQKRVGNIGIADVSALGAAYMAGLGSGIFKDIEHLHSLHPAPVACLPAGGANVQSSYEGWKKALE